MNKNEDTLRYNGSHRQTPRASAGRRNTEHRAAQGYDSYEAFTEAVRQAECASGHKDKRIGKDRKRQKMQEPFNYEEPPRKRRRGCGCFFGLLFTLLLLVIVAAGALASYWYVAAKNVPTPIDQLPVSEQRAEAERRSAQNINFLLVGDDERSADESARADTIMFAVMRPVDKKIAMVSIPRDTLVKIPDNGQDKINAALAYGRMPLLIDTVYGFLGPNTRPNHTIQVNFESFAKVIDAIGGITIDVPQRMYLPEEGIDLQPGVQKLNGKDALAFVRWRGDGLGDIGRIERQKVFMQAIMHKCKRLMPWQAVRLMFTLQNEVKTDLTVPEMIQLANKMIGANDQVLQYEHFELTPQYINGISYVLINRQNVRQVINRMRYGADINF